MRWELSTEHSQGRRGLLVLPGRCVCARDGQLESVRSRGWEGKCLCVWGRGKGALSGVAGLQHLGE